MKKILNEVKADAIAIYNALDIASGGNLSLIKQSIAQTFHGFLEAKFNNLVEDIISGGVSEEEFLLFINSQSNRNKNFISNLILKNLHSDNRITTFLLAKLLIQKIKNGSLNYYESSLFSNINTLTFEDFEIYYNAYRNHTVNSNENIFETKTSLENRFFITSLDKFKSIGIISHANSIDESLFPDAIEIKIVFVKTFFSEIFFDYLKEFFENN